MEVCYDLKVLLKNIVKQIKFAVNHVHFQIFSVKEKAICGCFFFNRTQHSLSRGLLWKLSLQTFADSLEKCSSIITFPQYAA